MTVDLWYKPAIRFPGGFRSTFNSYEEAMSQAVADIESGRSPAPDRIVDENGAVLADSATIDAAATSA